MVEQDFTLHSGQDFDITYVVPPESDMTLSQYKGACKIRQRPYDDMTLEVPPVIESKQVRFFISGQESAKKKIRGGDYIYDAFLYNDDHWLKIGQGTITIVPDISMHD